ncbi:TDP-N-acetylfucosamine:lipid II N-acetylfucosaminyltransferase [Shewanella aegiceratis]|uniref:TDP-N-acetylfucosamine:lipid II N-acetylfucosaminyltransferase n=1 Tax=Shewanella aegiceratis TaxID=2864203 RepID=UPI001C659016|nr:TDP-N-acetylfucosamine:lipid II N-acetylfucosaminyltransferase [Shewanella aegiceratis]QYJ83757.1 TDP-N-acetylfucosamine:lipid II N-acetylfucosaminyltransferase [Shewanella aegiceratis]
MIKNNLKVLHLAVDEKFIDMGLESFDQVGLENDLIVFSDQKLKYIKRSNVKLMSRKELSSINLKNIIAQYKVVILHSLFSFSINFPRHVTVVWIGFGYDYYDLILPFHKTLLPKTKKHLLSKFKLIPFLKSFFYILNFRLNGNVKRVINRVDYFCPVLFEEYELITSNYKQFNPKFLDWNYGNLEDTLVKGLMDRRVNGTNIMIGNSASATNNHFDIVEKISKRNLGNNKVIMPLSYGDRNYASCVKNLCVKRFGNKFVPLESFLPIDDYIEIQCSCSIVIMNHVRQQALGNIITALYLGAKVFLMESNPIFEYLKRNGLILFSISELEEHDLESILSGEKMEINRMALRRMWSRDIMRNKTKCLSEYFQGSTLGS